MTPKPQQKILHVVGSLNRTWGGLSLYVTELAAKHAALGHRVHVACQPGHSSDCWPIAGFEVSSSKPGSKKWESALDDADLVHVHGLWLAICHQAMAGARSRNKPCLLSTHGMLEPGALKFSTWKKRAALWLYQNKDLHQASALHATADSELRTLREFGLKQPVAVLPPGIEVSPAAKRAQRTERIRRALFIGRIHPKKGILSLVDAWASVQPKGWRLDIAGPDEGGHASEVKAKLQEHNLEDQVVCHGAVFGTKKEKLFSEASLFVAPSLSENFGIVVAEALAHGLPVIATTGMPWEVLVQKRCGWWVQPDTDSLAMALSEATQLPAEHLSKLGDRGRTLAETGLAWPRIAEQMIDTYAWLIGKTPAPSCVRVH